LIDRRRRAELDEQSGIDELCNELGQLRDPRRGGADALSNRSCMVIDRAKWDAPGDDIHDVLR
jgi:hypothetical protein